MLNYYAIAGMWLMIDVMATLHALGINPRLRP